MPKRRNLKPVPKFEPEDEERKLWATHDLTDYVDWSRAKRRFRAEAPYAPGALRATADRRQGLLSPFQGS